ncbi:MAG: uroporphyrinogen decarboxylase family protein [Planctomycetota bacterium]
MMTSYQVVRRAIEFERPERVPLQFAALGVDDTFHIGPKMQWQDLSARERLDEWGCRWEKSEVKNMGQVKGHPLDDWRKLKSHKFPDASDDSRYVHIAQAIEKAGDNYVIATNSNGLFERLYFLHGYAESLADMLLERQNVERLLDIILDYHITTVQKYGEISKGRIHGYNFCDDWGTQKGTTISVPMFQEVFKPRYKKLFNAIHRCGMHAWLHSCGKVNDFIPEFIEVGLDVINLQQPRALGIEEVGARCRGKICFSTLADIQSTLPHGTDEDIEEEVKLLLEKWGTPKGGIIASDYGDGEAIGVPIERKKVLLEAFQKYGNYRRQKGKPRP